jgi:multisubunit Na+/H+ antiporter MnhF subunit
MDQHPKAIWWETLRALLAISLLYWQQDWFGANIFFEYGKETALLYFLLSLITTVWFAKTEQKTATASTDR